MGTVTQLHERLRVIPARIGAEEDVTAVVAELAKRLSAPTSPAAVFDLLVQSGLLAISIPVDFGGLDVSNVVLAEMVATIAAGCPEAGPALATHFAVLEAIRNAGSEEQRRAIYARVATGERFAGLLANGVDQDEPQLRLVIEGIGYCLDGDVEVHVPLSAEWLVLSLQDERVDSRYVLVPREAQDLAVVAGDDGLSTVIFKRFHVAADAVLNFSENATPMSKALEQLLYGALALGRFRQTLQSALKDLRQLGNGATGNEALALKAEIGRAYVATESLGALISRCGTEIDIAQVTPHSRTIQRASQVAAATAIAVARAVGAESASDINQADLIELGSNLAKAAEHSAQSLETDRPH